MLYINQITNDASQQLTLTGIPGLQIGFGLQYYPRSQRWQASITYNNFTLDTIAVVSSLNILRQWRNVIPFGICCISADGLDPYQINDFANGNANLYLLDAADLATIEAEWYGSQ